ncbi:hypothetical protein L6164_014611 [Bauhinia variegata]|uniref:Uncharacterized protein n=1 Tax=Bauhinia variegata TaxID=167791 RepID=A0ACB9NMQ9_BAUVA|nr:hypothetical protein L6164_014611 [Bauhinia variegata]
MATLRGRISSRTPAVEDIVPSSAWSEDSTGHYLIVDLPGFKKEEVKLLVDSSGKITTRGEKQVSKEKRVRFVLSFPAPINSDVNNIAGKFDGEILYVTIPKRNVQETKESGAEKAASDHVGRAEENKREEKQNIDSDGRDYSQHVSHTEQEEARNEKSDMEGRDETQDGYPREKEETGNDNADSEGRDQIQHGYQREQEETRNDNAADINGGRDYSTQHGYHRKKEERRNGNAYMGGFPEELVRKWEQEPNILRSAVKILRKNKRIVVTAVLAFSLGLLVSRKFQSSTAP